MDWIQSTAKIRWLARALFLGMALMQGISPVCSFDNTNQVVKPRKTGSASDSTAQIARLEEQVEQQDKVIRQLVDSLAIARAESQMFQRQLQDLRLQREILGGSMTDSQLQERLVESVRNLYVSEQEKQKLMERLESLREALKTLLRSAEFTDMQARAALEAELRLTAKLLEEARKDTDTTLTAVDLNNVSVMNVNPALSLVILNAGRVQGVTLNMPFVVLRNDLIVGNVRVVEVREKFSGAVIERFKAGDEIREGDRAKVETIRP